WQCVLKIARLLANEISALIDTLQVCEIRDGNRPRAGTDRSNEARRISTGARGGIRQIAAPRELRVNRPAPRRARSCRNHGQQLQLASGNWRKYRLALAAGSRGDWKDFAIV